MRNHTFQEIEQLDELQKVLATAPPTLRHYAFQGINFTLEPRITDFHFSECIFIGCRLSEGLMEQLGDDCLVLPALPLPFNAFPAHLYSAEELYNGYRPEAEASFEGCYDTRVYRHYLEKGKQAKDFGETLGRSLHDHSISDALHDLLQEYDERRVVAVMGGHALKRTEEGYARVARIAKELTERGSLLISGGGPGAMEATHLGAWMAGRTEAELAAALEMLQGAPSFQDAGWLASAFAVRECFPQQQGFRSIGIPTWFYGHEPATPFATHIAKYFDNSIREDGLLAIAKGGVIYTPGSAGTMQEVFQDAAQNHYETFGYSSPMIFLGEDYWRNELPLYPLLEELSARGKYRNLQLTLTDQVEEVIATIEAFREE